MRRIISVAFALLLLAATSRSQNKTLNPTVQVTNAYEAHFMEAQKPSALVIIPDSLYKFDLDFDYGGFENPYGGSSDFNPFFTTLEFARKQYLSKHLILKAGAGYVLSPELDLTWGIKQNGRFKAGAFASHDSYYGRYSMRSSSGYDSRSRAGVDMRYDWRRANIILTLGYDGVAARDGDVGVMRRFNDFSACLALNSNLDPALSQVRYRLMARYDYGTDCFDALKSKEHVIDADGFIDLVFGKHLIGLDADFDMARGDTYSGASGIVRPRYIFSTGGLVVEAGVAIAISKADGEAVCGNSFDLFPSVDLRFKLVPQKMELYAVADMSSRLFSNRDAALKTRFYVPDPERSITKDFFAFLGFKGRFADKFSYDLSGGYHRSTSPALYNFSSESVWFEHVPSLEYLGASLSLDSKLGAFSFGGSLKWRGYLHSESLSIVPPSFIAGFHMGLKLRNRWNAGVSADYQSYWRSGTCYADDFVNLQAELRYNFTSRFAVYAKGLNLLGQSLQYVPGYGRNAVSILGGIVLTI